MSAAKKIEISPYPTEIECTNPATGQVLGTVPCTQLSEMPGIFEKAQQAQTVWAEFSFKKRRAHIAKIRNYLVAHSEEIAELVSKSTGKTLTSALSEVLFSISATEWYAKNAEKALQKQNIPLSNVLLANKRSYLLREPYGVVGIITPWNYPFLWPFNEIIMGLMAGNAILYKVAEETALVGKEIETILQAGDLPDGLTHLMLGDPPKLVNSWFENRIDKIFFTGSVRVGKILMKQAAEDLTPLSLELGGNDAMIVLEDANLERAANGAVWGGFFNSGQTCAGIERVYVHESVADRFIQLVQEKTENLRQGVDHGKFEVDVGSMTVSRQLQIVEHHVQDALKKGAKIAAQATIRDKQLQNFYPATVLTGVDHKMACMQEETFGPVIGIMTFRTEDEAIELANDSQLGLTASIWTMNNDHGKRLARKLESGSITINDHMVTAAMPELPWQGWKNSGLGSTHSDIGLEEMTKVKTVNYDLLPHLNKNLWWYPERRFIYDTFLRAFRVLYGENLRAKFPVLRRLLGSSSNEPPKKID